MNFCINPKSQKNIDLAKQLGLSPNVTAAKVGHWMSTNKKEDFPSIEDLVKANQVNYVLDAVDILASTEAEQVFAKGQKYGWSLSKILTELKVPKAQQDFIISSEETSREDIVAELLANYSYTIEINTAIEGINYYTEERTNHVTEETYYPILEQKTHKEITRFSTEKSATEYLNKHYYKNTQHYSNMTTPGGVNYTENELATPAIIPATMGHSQFSTRSGIGWFRSDEKDDVKRSPAGSINQVPIIFTGVNNYTVSKIKNGWLLQHPDQEDIIETNPTEILDMYNYGSQSYISNSKTRRILEIQSDLFQKRRNRQQLVKAKELHGLSEKERKLLKKTYDEQGEDKYNLLYDELTENNSDNKFLQLLNKDNAWVSFFIKATIQDSAKKGYGKVLFPTGDTITIIEQYDTAAPEIERLTKKRNKAQKEYNALLKEFKENEDFMTKDQIESEMIPIDSLKKEIAEDTTRIDHFNGNTGAVINFYEETVYNVLTKQGYSPELIVDEFKNTWYQVNVKPNFKNTISITRSNDLAKQRLYQLSDQLNITEAIPELDNFLLTFMKQFGVKSKVFDELKSRLGLDALGATDVVNKLIWYVKNRNEETIPEEVGHMIVMLMGETHPDIIELFKNISGWSEFAEIKAQYDPIYKNDKQVKIEALGKVIAKALVRNYKVNGLDKSLLEKALDAIREFLETILESINLVHAMKYNDSIADHIAINVLMGNKDYISKVTTEYPQVDYKKALDSNSFAQLVINTFTKDKAQFKMTGSLALAGQGESVYRDPESPIHDIDFRVNSVNEYEAIEDVLDEMNAVPYHFGWSNKSKDYKTYAFLIPKRGYSIKVLNRDMIRGNGWVTKYELLNSRGKVVPNDPQNHVAVDFFVNEGTNVRKSNGIFVSFSDIYDGKMALGTKGIHERMFTRVKDQTDYVLSNPKSIGESLPQFQYFQLSNKVDILVVDGKPSLNVREKDRCN